MPEIERKFLIERDPPLDGASAQRIEQGYVAIDADGTEVRVRRRAGDRLTLTIKSGDEGSTRAEIELALDEQQFAALWPLTAGRRICKDRFLVELTGGLTAEVDVYTAALDGLRVVEVEFDSPSASGRFQAPDWFGRELTDDVRYRNRRLALDGRPAS